jgi:hypothetical protein
LWTSFNNATHSVFKPLGPLLDKLTTILDILTDIGSNHLNREIAQDISMKLSSTPVHP